MPVYEYEKSGKKHYYYSFEVKDRNGKRKTIKQRGFTGKIAARDAEREAREALKKGQYIDPSKITFGEYITHWLEHKQDISPETRETNEGHLVNHVIPVLGHIKLQEVNVSDIKNFIKTIQTKEVERAGKKKKLAAGTIKKIYNLVQTCFNTATIEETIAKNPFNLLDKSSKPKVTKTKIDYWSAEEVKQFFSRLDHRLRILFVLAIYTGMRRGEILGLRWMDVDFDNSLISIQQTLKPRQRIKDGGKNENAARSISISPHVLNELKSHRSASIKERWACMEELRGQDEELKKLQDRYEELDLVLCQPNGYPVSLGNFNKFWKRILMNTEMREIRFHDLRHTCASLLLKAGIHPKVVQELLGHASIKITLDTYSHMMPNMQEDAVKALDRLLQ